MALSACGTGVEAGTKSSESADTAQGPTVTVKNCDRTITSKSVPDRAVGLSPSQTELLVELGLADTLVGQAQTATHELPSQISSQIEDVAELSTTTPPTRESLLGVEPDAVVAPTTYEFTAEQGFASIDQLTDAGALTYVATGGCPERRSTATVEDLFTDIDNLGRIFRVEDEAAKLSEEGHRRLDAVDKAIDGKARPTVAQLYIEGKQISATGAGVEYDIIKRAGGANVFDPHEKLFEQFFSAMISPEELSARNPDAIVFAVTDDDHEQRVRDYLHETFPDVTAVKEDLLIPVAGSDMFPGTLGNITAVETIAKELYPEAFPG